MLGGRDVYRDVPFFWSAHYDVTIAYVGHVSTWDRILEAGDLASKSYLAAYENGGKILAAACIVPLHALSMLTSAVLQRHLAMRALQTVQLMAYALGYAVAGLLLAATHWIARGPGYPLLLLRLPLRGEDLLLRRDMVVRVHPHRRRRGL